MRDKLAKRVHPLGITDPAETEKVIAGLRGLDGENWAAAWGDAGRRFAQQAAAAERGGNGADALKLWLQAYGFYFLGRFPCPNHAAKLECYRLEREAYVNAGRLMSPPLARVTFRSGGARVKAARWFSTTAGRKAWRGPRSSSCGVAWMRGKRR